jgi:hypothetical protein
MDEMKKILKWFIALTLLGLAVGLAGCGYRVRSSVGSLPEGIQSLGIPTFQNLTSEYKIEQRITGAVLKEFNLSTRVPVFSRKSEVDAVLLGEITRVSSVPVTFGDRSFGSAFMITIEIHIKMIRLKDSKVLWHDNNFKFRERYALNSDVRDFFFEENPALERMAQAFAASLVSTIIERRPLDSSKP